MNYSRNLIFFHKTHLSLAQLIGHYCPFETAFIKAAKALYVHTLVGQYNQVDLNKRSAIFCKFLKNNSFKSPSFVLLNN